MAMSGIDVPGRFRRITFSFESLGWRRALRELITARRPYDPARDTSFDDRHGTDTAGSVSPDRLGIVDDDRRQQAILYLPSPAPVTDVDARSRGCRSGDVHVRRPRLRQGPGAAGRRRPAVPAGARRRHLRPSWSTWHGPTPSATARRRRCGRRSTSSPPTSRPSTSPRPTCWSTSTTRSSRRSSAAVLQRLEASLAVSPRRVTIAYLAYTAAVEPVAEMFSGSPWLRPIRYEQSIRGHYNWLVYAN